MKQLDIKHLAPYLPYGLKVWYKDTDRVYQMVVSNNTLSIRGGININEILEGDNKPIIYSWDYLTKPITHNGETFVPIEWVEDKYYTLNYRLQCLRLLEEDGHNWINQTDYMLVQHLIEWRFDIFNLINDGLAIPVTEDFNPYNE